MKKAAEIMGASAYGKKSKLYARYIVMLAKILSARNKNQEAESLLLQAIQITGANKTDFYSDYLDAIEGLADFYGKWDNTIARRNCAMK